MGKFQEAVDLLKKTNEEKNRISDAYSQKYTPEELEDVTKVYYAAAEINVLASQLASEEMVCEGPCKVDNVRSVVTVGGFTVRGKVQFEIEMNGEWIKGHRDNSQYGQVFVSAQGSAILSENIKGRVRLPLSMDEN